MSRDACDSCEGTGYGSCANCGDGFAECACETYEEVECDVCNGTGSVDIEEIEDESS